MKFDFDRIIDRCGTWSDKWDMSDEQLRGYDMAEKRPEDGIYMSTADMDFQCAPCIKEALQKIVDRNLYGYTSLNRLVVPEYYEAVKGWMKRRHKWEIDAEDIMYVDGTIEALRLTLSTLTQPGDGVLITPPVYSPFNEMIQLTGRKVVKSHLINTDGYYTIDFEDFEKKAKDPHTTAFVNCSPHNPSGRVWTEEELLRLYRICEENGVLFISDEIHADLVRMDQEFIPIGRLVDGKNLIVTTGANKSFNIAGLHASNIITKNPEFRSKLSEYTGWISPTPFTVAAVIAAYTEGDEWLDQVRAYLDGNLEWAVDFLHKNMPKVRVRKPEGTYILWMDFRDYGLSVKELRHRICDVAGVIKEQGALFDEDHGDGFERVCLSTSRLLVQKAFQRICAAFEDLK